MGRGAWQAMVHRVAESWTRLKRLSMHTYCMPANLENSAVATGLGKVSFHFNPKERQWQRMLKLLHNCPYLTN